MVSGEMSRNIVLVFRMFGKNRKRTREGGERPCPQ